MVLVPVRHPYAVSDPSPCRVALIVVIGGSLIVYLAILPYLGSAYGARSLSLAYAAVIVGLVVLDMLAIGFRKGLTEASASVSEDTPTKGRLICHGEPGELASLRRVPSERRVLDVFYVLHRWSRRATKIWELIAIALFCVILHWFRHWSLPVLCVAVLPMLADWLRPRYVRLVSGRMETLDYRLLGRNLRSKRTYFLDDAKITCRYDQRRAIVQTKTETVEVDLRRFSRPHAFVEALFCAAMAPRDAAPELPTETFSG